MDFAYTQHSNDLPDYKPIQRSSPQLYKYLHDAYYHPQIQANKNTENHLYSDMFL